jgi:hypothetical protein
MSPWIGVVMISLGLGATLTLILTHNPVPASVGLVITAGVGLLQAAGHGQARELAVTHSAVPPKWLQAPVFAPTLTKVASWLPHARVSTRPPATSTSPTERPPSRRGPSLERSNVFDYDDEPNDDGDKRDRS